MVQYPLGHIRWRRYVWAMAGVLVLASSELAAQSQPEFLRRVRWPLLDVVVLPDSCIGLWLMVAPNPASMAWRSKTQLVQFGVDPIEALQWATVARGLTRTDPELVPGHGPRQTPPLRSKRGRRLIILASNSEASGPDDQFILAVSDSTWNTHWRAFASVSQVDSLVTAFELTAEHARTIKTLADSAQVLTDDDPAIESPVYPAFIPTPEYPRELWRRGRVGRVWLEYIVGPDGRAEEGSFRALLSDDERFTRAAVQALYRAKFRPARSRGTAIRQRVFQVISFRIG